MSKNALQDTGDALGTSKSSQEKLNVRIEMYISGKQMPLQNGSFSYLSNAKTGKAQYLKARDLYLKFTSLAPSWPEPSGAHLLALFHAFQLRLVWSWANHIFR